MKTITEFSGFTLKEAINKKAALLAEGKSEEEAQAAINEQLKLTEEPKIAFYKNAVDMCKSRIDQVKRVVVAVKASETEKVPEAFAEREGNFYLVEYFSQGGSASRGRDDDRFDRGGRGGRGGDRGRGGNDRGRGGDRGRDGGRGGDRPRGDRPQGDRPQGERTFGDRPPRGPRPERAAGAPAGGGERKPRPPRAPRPEGQAPRGPRPPRGDQGPKGAAELRLVLKGQSQSTLQGSGQAAPAASSETPQG